MVLKDQVEFLISDSRIHAHALAWKLRRPVDAGRTDARIFSYRFFSVVQSAANIDACPPCAEPQTPFRSSFGTRPAFNSSIHKG